MNIQIFSRIEMAQLLKSEPNKHNVIIIRAPEEDRLRRDELDWPSSINFRVQICYAYWQMEDLWKDCLLLEFDDAIKYKIGLTIATKEDIEKALSFCSDKDDVRIACAGGVSRSSALAYVIARSKIPKEEAIKILNKNKHRPNDLVLNLGSDILGGNLTKEILDAGLAPISYG